MKRSELCASIYIQIFVFASEPLAPFDVVRFKAHQSLMLHEGNNETERETN